LPRFLDSRSFFPNRSADTEFKAPNGFYWTKGFAMSSISASSIGQSVLQYIQQLASNSTTSAATTAAAATTSTAAPTSTGTPAMGGHHHHHRHGGGTEMQTIQDAVTNALQSAKENGSSADPNTVIKTAIEQILGGTNNSSPTDPTTTTTPTTDNDSAQSVFNQTLQSFGVDPQQFRNDFLSAIKDTQNGQPVSTANIFGSFPTGTQVDTTG
jgi:hypothetical protein